MTIQPITPLAAPSGGTAEAPTSGVDAEFAALIEQSLGNQSNPAQLPGNGGDPSGVSLGGAPAGDLLVEGQDPEPDADAESGEATGTDSDTAAALMSVLAGVVLVDSAKAAATEGPASSSVGATTATNVQSTTSPVSDTAGKETAQLAPVASDRPDSAPAGIDISELTPVSDAEPVTFAFGGAASGASGAANDASGTADSPTERAPQHGKAAVVDAATSVRTTASTPGDLGLAFSAPASSTGSVATAATAVSTPSATGHAPVADQVFGEVSRLVSRGDGSHRITIKLQPEALGDVHVTLSVKNGEVSVSLAAERHAHHALLEGAPELHRLLESVGAKSTDIVLKDLPSSSPRSDLLGQPGAQHGTGGREQSPDQTAGKQSGDTSARDGGTTGAAASRQPSPIDPGTRTRSTGVDVTM